VSEPQTTSYDVTVEGDIGPSVSAALRDLCQVRKSRFAQFRARCLPDRELEDLTELLEKRGFSVISIRLVPGAGDDGVPPGRLPA
jgi:hypothetical protein